MARWSVSYSFILDDCFIFVIFYTLKDVSLLLRRYLWLKFIFCDLK